MKTLTIKALDNCVKIINEDEAVWKIEHKNGETVIKISYTSGTPRFCVYNMRNVIYYEISGTSDTVDNEFNKTILTE